MVLEANGRDSMVTDDLCPLAFKPRHERECLMTESTRCGTEWEEDEWGEVCYRDFLQCKEKSNIIIRLIPFY